jgi:hypothetical protein
VEGTLLVVQGVVMKEPIAAYFAYAIFVTAITILY